MGSSDAGRVTLFLAGDVMSGRGVDQIQRHPSAPQLRECFIKDARDYVRLAERVHGPIPAPVGPSYVWGDARSILERRAPAAGIINLETSLTASDDFWPNKPVHYRMHPANVGCLVTPHVDVCVLANNHVLDFGVAGLFETLETLRAARIQVAGAGRDLAEASRPACVDVLGGTRVLVFAFGHASSGVPEGWAATRARPGIRLLPDLSAATVDELVADIAALKRAGDLVVASIHWGDNWGYEIAPAQRVFAHALIDGGVDVVHGHSSHHVRAIERHAHKLILYGCGDLLTDYEGIESHKAWRGDLGAMYFATLDAKSGALVRLELVLTEVRRMRLARADVEDARWLRDKLNEISRPLGAELDLTEDAELVLRMGEGR